MIEDDYTKDSAGNKKDSKRYNGKKSEIQKARRQKRTLWRRRRQEKDSLYK